MMDKSKKKKHVDREEEEKLKSLLKKPVEASTLNNAALRPWTVNPAVDEVLAREISALDKTIVITAHAMKAGDRGLSVLDRKIPEVPNLEETLKSRVRATRVKSLYDDYLVAYGERLDSGETLSPKKSFYLSGNNPNKRANNASASNGYSSWGNMSVSGSGLQPSDQSNIPSSSSNQQQSSKIGMNASNRFLESTKYFDRNRDRDRSDDFSEVDMDHVHRVQKMIHAKTLQAQHRQQVPLQKVAYQPVSSSPVISMSITEYEKMKKEINANMAASRTMAGNGIAWDVNNNNLNENSLTAALPQKPRNKKSLTKLRSSHNLGDPSPMGLSGGGSSGVMNHSGNLSLSIQGQGHGKAGPVGGGNNSFGASSVLGGSSFYSGLDTGGSIFIPDKKKVATRTKSAPDIKSSYYYFPAPF